jgi:hypothetical protein
VIRRTHKASSRADHPTDPRLSLSLSPSLSMTDLNLKGDLDNPWKAFLSEVYLSGKPPYPLGTVSPAEIEERAQEKLKEYPGKVFHAQNPQARVKG